MENLVKKKDFFLIRLQFFLLGATIGFDLHVRFDDTDPKIKRLEVMKLKIDMIFDHLLVWIVLSRWFINGNK